MKQCKMQPNKSKSVAQPRDGFSAVAKVLNGLEFRCPHTRFDKRSCYEEKRNSSGGVWPKVEFVARRVFNLMEDKVN